MYRSLMVSAALSALLISGALAQTSPPASAPAEKPAAAETKSPHFIQAQGTDKWVFSKFKGTDVLGPDNAKVGKVTDLLFDKNGKIDGLIVGVGGFLGIGEKDVAIGMSAFNAVPHHEAAATTGAGGGAGGTRAMNAENDPTRVDLKVSWTKDELKAAPDFQYYRAPARTAASPGSSPTTGMGARPGPASPMAPTPRQ
jgi:sporulation protein YlmC with PRC-barrel domain